MKLRLLLFAAIFLLGQCVAFAQAGEWTWIKGSNLHQPQPVFGTQGVADSTNYPPGVYEPCEWTDTSGNFWFFGGVASPFDMWGDLWMLNPLTNNWNWVSGTGQSLAAGATGNYGIQGVPSVSNQPGPRGWGIPTWVDNHGDLWLYGGWSWNGFPSDMWRYNIATDMWTWMQGPDTGHLFPTYGTLGVESDSNSPGMRWECSATWVDSADNLWLYGGYCPTGQYGDLWKYNTATNNWTWVNGSTFLNQAPVYGAIGIPEADNTPGGRCAYCSWNDFEGNFWLYGGLGADGSFNDMWKYEPVTGNWTWMAGTRGSGNKGLYGPLCVSSLGYESNTGFETRARWKDDCGNFWFYGGAIGSAGDSAYNDLWYFNPVTLKWTFVNGSDTANIPPIYGTMGVASPVITPGGRYGTVAWRSKAGELYLYGGTTNYYNDLWKFTIDTSCGDLGIPASLIIKNSDTIVAENALTYQWFFNGAALPGATDSVLVAPQSGAYSLFATGANGCVSTSSVVNITVSGITNLANELSLKIYPNPATDELNISYRLNTPSNLQITIIDMTGRRIANVLNEKELSGNYLQHANIRDLASAVYILSFTSDSGSLPAGRQGVNLRFVKE